MNRPYGFYEPAFKKYITACFIAGVNPDRVLQTIGTAPASAGYHAKDGTYTDTQGIKRNYCAATDIRSKDLTEKQCIALITALKDQGFAAFWRHTGSFANNQHIHFVYSACFMKAALRGQVRDFVVGKDGLKYHRPDPYWKDHPLTEEERKRFIRNLIASNPELFSLNFDEDEEDFDDCQHDGHIVPDDD